MSIKLPRKQLGDHKFSVQALADTNIDLNNGPVTIDGVKLSIGSRVLLINQTAAPGHFSPANGIYVVKYLGCGCDDEGGMGTKFIRAADADNDEEFNPGTMVYVENGCHHAVSYWANTTVGSTVFKLGVTGIRWTQIYPFTGAVGPAGPQGPQGAPGSIGPQGPAGPSAWPPITVWIDSPGTQDRVFMLNPASTWSLNQFTVQTLGGTADVEVRVNGSAVIASPTFPVVASPVQQVVSMTGSNTVSANGAASVFMTNISPGASGLHYSINIS